MVGLGRGLVVGMQTFLFATLDFETGSSRKWIYHQTFYFIEGFPSVFPDAASGSVEGKIRLSAG